MNNNNLGTLHHIVGYGIKTQLWPLIKSVGVSICVYCLAYIEGHILEMGKQLDVSSDKLKKAKKTAKIKNQYNQVPQWECNNMRKTHKKVMMSALSQ